jgi:hypothetical protein
MSQLLALKTIRTDGGTQPRAALNQDRIGEYADDMARGDEFPPVTVFYDGADYWLADGFHHYHARATRHPDIEAEVRQGTKRDAILFSVGANASHGMRPTNEDKRRAVLKLLGDPEWSQWSDREIARLCAVSDRFVNGLRPQAPSANSSQIEQPRTVSRGSSTYRMNTAGLKRAGRLGTRQAAATKAETLRATPAQNRDADDVIIHVLHLLRNLRDASEAIEPAVLLRKVPADLRHNIDLTLPQAADFASGLYTAWRAAMIKPSEVLGTGTDGRPVLLNRFFLSLRSVYDMIEEIGREPDQFLVYAAQHRTHFNPHVVKRVAKFLSDLADLLKADLESAAADIRATGTAP